MIYVIRVVQVKTAGFSVHCCSTLNWNCLEKSAVLQGGAWKENQKKKKKRRERDRERDHKIIIRQERKPPTDQSPSLLNEQLRLCDDDTVSDFFYPPFFLFTRLWSVCKTWTRIHLWIVNTVLKLTAKRPQLRAAVRMVEMMSRWSVDMHCVHVRSLSSAPSFCAG